MITVSVITANNDLAKLVADINQAAWDTANDMVAYDVASLSAYLACQDTVFVACYDTTDSSRIFMGMASARLQIKPYDKMRWLYIDEVDVCADQRHKGAGKAIIKKLIAIAQDAGCDEVWLGTETDNQPAKALYQSLAPDEVEQIVGYTYELD